MKTQNFFPYGTELITDPETGYTIRGIAGGAEEEDSPPVEEEEQEEEEPEEEDDDDEVDNFNGETFLSSIEDEELRAQLEPHVKRWDAGVTRRFQELHSELRPYQDLGEYEQLNEAYQLYQILNTNPKQLYDGLSQALGYNTQQQGQPGPQSQTPPNQQGGTDGLTQQQFAQLPPQIQRQLEQQQQILETLATEHLNSKKAQEQAQEDAELDSYLSNLATEFGEFDEDYVLSKMMAGMDGAKAVKQYRKAVHKANATANAAQAPKVLSGGGQLGQETLNVGELPSNQVKELVAGLLGQANQAGD